jgi:hypothetical protein
MLTQHTEPESANAVVPTNNSEIVFTEVESPLAPTLDDAACGCAHCAGCDGCGLGT